MKKAISIEELCYWDLFNSISLEVNEQDFITISGPNNCGKTTLLRILDRDIITENNIKIFEDNINTYKIDDYSKLVQCVIPEEKSFQEDNLEEEILLYNSNKKETDEILKEFKWKKMVKKDFSSMTNKERLISSIVIALVQNPKLLLIDQLSTILEVKETIEILKALNNYRQTHNITIVYTTINLIESIETDYLYIISEKKISMSGNPLEVLKEDNKINKIGLKLPFMIDLSVKLKDYDLIDEIELDKSRMVDILWK